MPGDLNVFISYARKDGRDEADALYKTLNQRGIRAWRDERDLDTEQDFTAEIETAIEDASHVAVCVTPESKREDSFVRREIQYALLLNKTIIPLRFADIPPHIHIATLSWIDFFGDWEAGLDSLVHRLTQTAESGGHRPHPRLNADPFRAHVETLAQHLVNELRLRVLNVFGVQEMMQLHSVETPDRVRARQIPVAYRSRLPGWLGGEQKEPQVYEAFALAFQRHERRVLLLGEPGAGKTTTLLAAARDAAYTRLADATAPLPIYAPVYTWNRGESLFAWLARVTDLSGERLQDEMENRRAVLFLDGLDELSANDDLPEDDEGESRDDRVRFLQALAEVGETPALVTCRVQDYDQIVQKGGEKIALNGAVTLSPLTDAQIEAYLREQPALWAAVQADDDLREMVRTPLLLTLLAIAFRDAGEQARQLGDLRHSPGDLRDEIFRSYVRRCYEIEQMRSPAALPFTLVELYNRLGMVTLSVLSYVRRHDQFEIDTATFTETETGYADSLIELAQALHLLIPVRPGVYRYIHLLLRDYVALPVCLAGLTDSDDYRRSKAARALGLIHDARALNPLLAALKDEAPNVRWEAAHALGELGEREAVPALIEALADADEAVRWNAAWGLGHLRDERAVDPLIALLNDQVERVKLNAATALGTIRAPRSIAPLIETLHDPRKSVRRSVTWALINIGTPALEQLIAALKHQSVWVRGHAARALGKIGDARAVTPLIETLHDENKDVRWRAGVALGRIPEPDLGVMLAALNDEDKEVRRAIISALKFRRDGRTIDTLVRAVLEDPSRGVSRVAWDTLQPPPDDLIDRFLDALADPRKEVRNRAARALGEIKDGRAFAPLVQAARDPEWPVRANAVRALGYLGDPRAFDPLIAALKDVDWHVRSDAVRALVQLGDARAIDLLKPLLDDPEGKVRHEVRVARHRLGGKRDWGMGDESGE